MASEQRLSVIISAIDRASEVFKRVSANIVSMTAPLRHVHDRLGALAEETGLKRVGEHARGALFEVRNLGRGLLDLAGPLAGLTAAGSVAGLVELAKSTGEFYEKLSIGATATGVSAAQLSGWHYAAGLMNIDVERLDRGFGFLNRNIALAAAGKAKDLQSIFAGMGFANTTKHMLGTSTAMRALADETKHLVDSGQTQLASNMLAKAFGARAGMQLLPLFSQGSAGLDKMFADAKLHGLVPTPEQLALGKEFGESQKQLTAAVLGTKLAIGNALIPVLQPVIKGMTDWLDVNRQWLAGKFADAVKNLADYVKSIDWSRIGDDLQSLGRIALTVSDHLGGFKGVLAAIAAVSFGPAILAFGNVAVAVAGFGAKIVIAGAQMLAFPVAAFLSALTGLGPEITGLSRAWWALNAAMAANPVGAIIAGAALLGVAVYEIYQHWDGVKAFFKDIWAGVTATFNAAWQAIQPIITALRDAMDWIGDKLKWLADNTGLSGLMDSQYADAAATSVRARNLQAAHAASGGVAAAAVPAERVNATEGAQRMAEWLKGHGYSANATAAIMGNAKVESGFNPRAGLGRAHQGLFQWDDTRWRGGDFDAQMGHMDRELSRLAPGLKTSDAPAGDLAARFENVFERSGGQLLRERVASAKGYAASPAFHLTAPAAPAAAQSHAKIQLHVSADPQLKTGLTGVETRGNPDLDLNLGHAFAPAF